MSSGYRSGCGQMQVRLTEGLQVDRGMTADMQSIYQITFVSKPMFILLFVPAQGLTLQVGRSVCGLAPRTANAKVQRRTAM